jgi:Transcription factor IIA, alpha/beta subunit
MGWSHNNDSNNSLLKRRISEVSDVDVQPSRPTPAIDPLPYYPPTTTHAGTHPPVLHPSLNHLYPSPPPKRRPDPNDDTIGSDLDDSEDEGDIDSEDEDEDMPLMLCSYEKVHRTKNKWRANLTHGVVCINGREWVFEKGNGEYEW